jgi:hypothetical protein
MKIASRIILFAATAFFTTLHTEAQFVFHFTSQPGNGSFTLNTNHLVGGGDVNSARYTDVLDRFTFDGVTYTNLEFSVWNNNFTLGTFGDGFQILVDRFSQDSSESRLEIDVKGNSTVVTNTTVSDLLKVLTSFTALQSNATFRATVTYLRPQPPFQLVSGTMTSFGLLPAPLITSVRAQTNGFGFDITGATGITAVVEVRAGLAANLAWSPFQTNLMTNGTWFFTDPTWTNAAQRFYRVRTP